MSVRSDKSNAPLRRTDKKKIERIKKRTQQLVSEGKIGEEEAKKQAQAEEFDGLR